MPWQLRQFKHSNEGLRDDDLQGLPVEERDFDEVDLSRNLFGLSGLRRIIDFLQQQRHLRVLKLYRCGLDDEAAELLSKFFLECRSLEEVHLSHNRFTAYGAAFLARALERNRDYSQIPIWLRLEHNAIEKPEKVLADFERHFNACGFHGGKCATKECYWRRKLHLPYFLEQDTVHWDEAAPNEFRIEDKEAFIPSTRDDDSESRASDDSELDCRGRGLRAWHHAEPERQVCHGRSRSPFARALDAHQLLAWQEKLLRRERELDELERLAMSFVT
mmetsp:Transcript_39379/g.82054  ORF Transcript_39379/g.82054 Transcript_39379/m.82054 type:complete len:275 (+) Transcript_39379:44-868(+)